MRPGVAVLSLSLCIMSALAAAHREPTLVHGSNHLQLYLPLFNHLSWLLPDDDLRPSAYSTGSTKPVVAQ